MIYVNNTVFKFKLGFKTFLVFVITKDTKSKKEVTMTNSTKISSKSEIQKYFLKEGKPLNFDNIISSSNENNTGHNNESNIQHSETQQHLKFHKSNAKKVISNFNNHFQSKFNKDTNKIINDWYGSNKIGIISSNREQYYKRHQEKLLEYAKNNNFQKDVLPISQKMPTKLLKYSSYVFMEDNPIAKYNLQDMMMEEPNTIKLKSQNPKISHYNNCLNCTRSQLRIQHLENQLKDQEKLQIQLSKLKSEESEIKRLEKYVGLLEMQRNPIKKLQNKINELEQQNYKFSKHDNIILNLESELEKSNKCNEWFSKKFQDYQNHMKHCHNTLLR